MVDSTRGTARKSSSGEIFRSAPVSERSVQSVTADAQTEIAGYIAQLTAEMSQMAERAGLDTLAYFLSMARLEAEMARRHHRIVR